MTTRVIVSTLQGRIIDANEAASDLLGLPAEKVMGQWIDDFLMSDDRRQFLESLQDMAKQCARKILRVHLRNSSGEVIPTLITASAMRDDRRRVDRSHLRSETQLPAA